MTGAYPVRSLSVLTEAFDNIIEAHYPGLVESAWSPAPARTAADDLPSRLHPRSTPGRGHRRRPDADHKVRCPKSRS